MTQKPRHLRCSVALATFNGERYLPEQLDSLLDQDQVPDEIIICDDASTDGTAAILEHYSSRYPHLISVYHRRQNRGFISTFEEAITRTSGDLVFLCDQDDVWARAKIAIVAVAFEANPEVGVIFSDADLIDEYGRHLRGRRWTEQPTTFTDRDYVRWISDGAFPDLLTRNPVGGSSMAFRALYKPLILPFPPVLGFPRTIHDGWIALAISTVAELLPIPQSLSRYRLHPQQQAGVRRDRMAESGIRRWLHEGKAHREFQAACLAELAKRLKANSANLPPPRIDVQDLDARVKHLRSRVSMPGSSRDRLRTITRELRCGAYSRYSSGWRSALIDLVTTGQWDHSTPG